MSTETQDQSDVDLGHRVTNLIQQVSRRLSGIVDYPRDRPILDVTGHPASAICLRLDNTFVLTSRGLAKVTRFLFWESKPRLISHTAVTLIEPKKLKWLEFMLNGKLDDISRRDAMFRTS